MSFLKQLFPNPTLAQTLQTVNSGNNTQPPPPPPPPTTPPTAPSTQPFQFSGSLGYLNNPLNPPTPPAAPTTPTSANNGTGGVMGLVNGMKNLGFFTGKQLPPAPGSSTAGQSLQPTAANGGQSVKDAKGSNVQNTTGVAASTNHADNVDSGITDSLLGGATGAAGDYLSFGLSKGLGAIMGGSAGSQAGKAQDAALEKATQTALQNNAAMNTTSSYSAGGYYGAEAGEQFRKRLDQLGPSADAVGASIAQKNSAQNMLNSANESAAAAMRSNAAGVKSTLGQLGTMNNAQKLAAMGKLGSSIADGSSQLLEKTAGAAMNAQKSAGDLNASANEGMMKDLATRNSIYVDPFKVQVSNPGIYNSALGSTSQAYQTGAGEAMISNPLAGSAAYLGADAKNKQLYNLAKMLNKSQYGTVAAERGQEGEQTTKGFDRIDGTYEAPKAQPATNNSIAADKPEDKTFVTASIGAPQSPMMAGIAGNQKGVSIANAALPPGASTPNNVAMTQLPTMKVGSQTLPSFPWSSIYGKGQSVPNPATPVPTTPDPTAPPIDPNAEPDGPATPAAPTPNAVPATLDPSNNALLKGTLRYLNPNRYLPSLPY